ncbi:MAG: ATP-binding protein [Rhodocyclaceae bacterium]|nr:ATP-binding protein [Rhodocyclaceae bacterium]
MQVNRWVKLLQSVRGLWGAVVLTNLFVFAIVGYDLYSARGEYRAQAEKSLANLSWGLEGNVAALLDKVDLTLQTVADEVRRQHASGKEDAAALDALLERQSARLPEIVGLRVADARGDVRHAAGGVANQGGNISDRERFQRLRRDVGGGLTLDGPLMGRVSGKMVLVLARRVSRPDGSFDGEVHAALEISRLTALASAMNLGSGGLETLWSEDRRVLMRHPDGGALGSNKMSSQLAALIDSGLSEAAYDTVSRIDGATRLFYYRRIPGRPLYLTVGLSEQTWLEAWYQDVWRLGSMMLAFTLLTLLSAWVIHKGVVAREAAVAELERAGSDLQAVLDNVPALIGYWDRNLKNRFGNYAYQPWFGMAPMDIRGKTMREVLGEERYRLNLPYVEAALRGEPQRFERSIVLSGGRDLSTLTSYVPDMRGGQVQGFYALVIDITAIKQAEKDLERESQRNRLLLRAASDGIHVLDEAGCLLEASDAFCAMLGFDREELLGAHMSRWDARWSPDELGEVVRGLSLGKTVFETRYRCRDGRLLDVEISSIGVELDGQKLIYCSARDISDRKEAQRALESHQILLEEKVAARTVELQVARQDAERVARVKGDFLANMSHEIRTPLNAVIGLSRMGMKDSAGREIGEVFHRIQDAGSVLLGVVNDILDFSKIEAGKLILEEQEVELAEILDRAVDMVAARAYGKKLEFTLDEAPGLPPRMRGDGLRLTQVLVNLLSNAVKFTDPGGRISLFVSREGEHLVFAISDTGIGMAPEQVARLFTPFEQADGSTSRRYGGTGLGLAICKRLVDLMQGEIRVDSAPDAGSTFRVFLPFRASSEGVPAAEAPPGGEVALCGMDETEAAGLEAELSAAGVVVRKLEPDEAVSPGARLVVADGEACRGRCGVLKDALDRGINAVLLVTPETEASGNLCLDHARRILRPLRARHVLRAMRDAVPAYGVPTGVPRLSGIRILAAEDNDVNRLVLEDMLVGEGARYTCVENGRQLVDWLRRDGRDAYDLILTDIQMPEMDGLEATRAVLEMAPGMPVIGLTAHAMPEERDRCLACGMVEHIAKPVDLDVLVAAILKHVGRAPDALPEPPNAHPEEVPQASVSALPSTEQPASGEGGGGEDIIDWQALDTRYRGKAPFIAKVLRMAIAGNLEVAGKLREAAEGGDLPSVAKISHNLKSLGGNLAAPAFTALATRTDAAAKAEAPEVFDLGRELAAALDEVLNIAASRLDGDGNYLGTGP